MINYESLQTQLNLNKGVPYNPDWSAAADFLQLIVDYCREVRPASILECGSGLTTLMMARCCQLNGGGRIFSLEDGEEYAGQIRSSLQLYGLEAYVSVLHAPLQQIRVDTGEYAWYQTGVIPDRRYDMLVIDGPSGFLQKNSRYPALPLLYSQLTDGCRIFLDDASRPDEQEILALWQARFPQLESEMVENTRGCAVLTIHK